MREACQEKTKIGRNMWIWKFAIAFGGKRTKKRTKLANVRNDWLGSNSNWGIVNLIWIRGASLQNN